MDFQVSSFEQHPDAICPLRDAFTNESALSHDHFSDQLVPNLRLNPQLVDPVPSRSFASSIGGTAAPLAQNSRSGDTDTDVDANTDKSTNRYLMQRSSQNPSSTTLSAKSNLTTASIPTSAPSASLRQNSQIPASSARSSVAPSCGSPASFFLSKLNTQLSCEAAHGDENALESPQLGNKPPSSQAQTLLVNLVGGYRLGAVVGNGGSSVVREAFKGGQVSAVKVIDKRRVSMQRLDYEREIWLSLHHPHILPLDEVLDTSSNVYLFCPLVRGGSLHDLVRRNRCNITPDLIQTLKGYVVQLVSAMAYLHKEMKIVHGDIKLENCLLDSTQNNLLLCDFGLCHYIDDDIDDEFERSRFIDCGSLSRSVSQHNSWTKNTVNSNSATNIFQAASDWRDPSNSRSLIGISERLLEEDALEVEGCGVGGRALMGTDSDQVDAPMPGLSSSVSKDQQTPFNCFLNRPSSTSRDNSAAPSRKNSVSSTRSLGLCRVNSVIGQEQTVQGGTLHSAAPEQLNGGTLTTAIDIWALGVLVYTSFTGKYPWHHSLPPKLRQMILHNDYDEPTQLDEISRHLISGCLAKDFMLRPTIEEVLDLVCEWHVTSADAPGTG